MNMISPWAATVQADIKDGALLLEKALSEYNIEISNAGDSIWISIRWPNGCKVGFRAAFGLNSCFEVQNVFDDGKITIIQLGTRIGKYEVRLECHDENLALFHYTTTFIPDIPMLIPFWPRDIVPVTTSGSIENASGKIHVHQVGARSGLLFASVTRPKPGSFFYFQNLTAMNAYCDATETSLAETVGGSWPEIGFQLPTTTTNPLPSKKKYTISDAYVVLSTENPQSDNAVTQQFLDHLATVYHQLPKPKTTYQRWPEIVKKGLNDASDNQGCWSQSGGNSYLNAYLCDYKTPPELMVQLAVLTPVTEYLNWSGGKHEIAGRIKNGLETFYDAKLKTMVRWLPSRADDLDGSEEQKQDMVMDSWYLHHPLMNLSRLALAGDTAAEKLVLAAIDYPIKVARHFKYEWPVFYKMDTLEVVKKETAPGKGGETDVAGSYAHLMLLVWKLTGDEKYLREAKKAAKKLAGLGLNVFYQANNTAFSSVALLELYKETNDAAYLDLSYACLSGIFRNVHLWECNYGHAKDCNTFFAVYPLNDAPYCSAYEELEVYAALSHYLEVAEDVAIKPSVKLLVSEFVRYAVNRLAFYYPPMLPDELFADAVKTGEVDKKLWIPIEDLQDGWDKSGQIGQEVYGAGLAFAVVPRQYRKVPGEDFMVYSDYPIADFKIAPDKSITLKVIGDPSLACRLMLVGDKKLSPERFTVAIIKGKNGLPEKFARAGDKLLECAVPGDSKIRIKWT